MIDKTLLSILACPETKKDLELADKQTVAQVNDLIRQGKLLNRAKERVSKNIDGGLFRKGDRSCLYPIRDNIPILLIDELILLNEKSS
ncbi:MAG TPA: hypothetical protein VI749_05595 [Candidatus Omnitrophota bacterium]|nr:hypothetical protein [Candidatus Omnitrophota bacterium]